MKYIDPDPKFDQSPQWLPVHQGPESLLPERIKLSSPARAQDEEQIDSGFGPFGLCRLAYETGGLYFTVHPNRKVGKKVRPWETAAMSSHLADVFRRARDAQLPARVRIGRAVLANLLKSNTALQRWSRRRGCRRRRRWKTCGCVSRS